MLLDKFFLCSCFFSPICKHIYMKLAWKIYFWIYSILTVSGIAVIYSETPLLNLSSLWEIFMSLSLIMGIYSYLFKKNFLPRLFWVFTFWVIVVLDTLYRFFINFTILKTYLEINLPVFLSSQIGSNYMTFGNFFLGISLSIPTYIAIYRLSKDRFLD